MAPFDRSHTSSEFLLAFHRNNGPILYHFRDKAKHWSKIAIFRRKLLRYVPPYVIANLPVVCLSSVTFVQPAQRVELFGNSFSPFNRDSDGLCKNFGLKFKGARVGGAS